MKIHPDQIEGVQPEQTQRKNTAKEPGQAFGDILNQEVSKGQAPTAAAGVAPPQIVNPMIGVTSTEAVQPAADDGQVAGQVESILDKLDTYTADLAGPESGLKSAYSTLDQIADDVAAIRDGQPDLAETNPELGAIVDELETLAATEQFKFNRGDYV